MSDPSVPPIGPPGLAEAIGQLLNTAATVRRGLAEGNAEPLNDLVTEVLNVAELVPAEPLENATLADLFVRLTEPETDALRSALLKAFGEEMNQYWSAWANSQLTTSELAALSELGIYPQRNTFPTQVFIRRGDQ